MVPRQCTVGTNKMLAVSCLHSAANADGCRYQRKHTVGLLRVACVAGTMSRWKDAIISVLCIFQYTTDPNTHADVKGTVIAIHSFVMLPQAIF